MKSQEIREGDEFWHEGTRRWTATADAEVDGGDVLVEIRWDESQGGGRDNRAWDYDAEVNITRPPIVGAHSWDERQAPGHGNG